MHPLQSSEYVRLETVGLSVGLSHGKLINNSKLSQNLCSVTCFRILLRTERFTERWPLCHPNRAWSIRSERVRSRREMRVDGRGDYRVFDRLATELEEGACDRAFDGENEKPTQKSIRKSSDEPEGLEL